MRKQLDTVIKAAARSAPKKYSQLPLTDRQIPSMAKTRTTIFPVGPFWMVDERSRGTLLRRARADLGSCVRNGLADAGAGLMLIDRLGEGSDK